MRASTLGIAESNFDDVVGVPMWGDKFKVSGCLVPTRWYSRVDPGRSGDLSGSTNHA